MNAGFSSLTALKAQLLSQSLRSRTDFDAQLLALGLGVTGAIETFCNRKFARVAGDIAIMTGGRASIILPRYPIEAITALDVRDTITAGWTDSLTSLDTYNPESGTVYFSAAIMGAQIRVTYTGGFFWETKEPTEGGYPTALPGGATALPAAVITAWHLQCQAIWNAKDKLGTQIIKEPASQGGTAAATNIELIPAVKQMLAGEVRYALT